MKAIERYISRVEVRFERNKGGGEAAGEKAVKCLRISYAIAAQNGESPESLEDMKHLAEKQLRLDEAARRASPEKVKNN